jgi:hypothetical protein
MRKLWCFEIEKIGEKNSDGISISSSFFLKWNERERDYLKEREREKQNDQSTLGWSPRVDRVGHTWTEDLCPRVAHVEHTWQPCQGLMAILSLSRTLRVLRPFSAIRTPISNPSSDYESWLPYARRRLRNFAKMLRNHLGKQLRKWLNEWECKVA